MASPSTATRLGCLLTLFFVLAACFGSFFFIRGFLKSKLYIETRTKDRYGLLESTFAAGKELKDYLRTHQPSVRRPMYKQVHWMIIDGFASFLLKPTPNSTYPYENQMAYVNTHLQSAPEKAAIYTFLSEAPTMTNSRAEGLCTGSHTAYIKIATSFQRPHVEEDNIIEQLHANNYSSVLLGTALWAELYPRQHFKRIFVKSGLSQIPVDAIILEHLGEDFQRDDWNFLLTHNNGLDYEAHVQGWSAPRTMAVLKENDRIIDAAIRMMAEDSLILAFGDHGSLRKGGHGGGTKEELEAGLFTYTRKGFTFRRFQQPDTLTAQEKYLLSLATSKINMGFLIRERFAQIDLVPTMAAIFNIPIPYSNLGTVIPELMNYADCAVVSCFYELFMDHLLNYLQVANYVSDFVRTTGNLQSQEERLREVLKLLRPKVESILAQAETMRWLERNYLLGNAPDGFNAAEQTQYKDFVGDLFSAMQTIRAELEHNSLLFMSQWNSLNTVYMYSNVIIAITVIALMAGTSVILYLADRSDISDLIRSPLTSGYTISALLVLFAGTLWLSPELGDLSLALTYLATVLSVLVVVRLCLQRKAQICAVLARRDVYIPLLSGIAVVSVQALAYTWLIMEAQEKSLQFALYTGLVLLFILAAYKGREHRLASWLVVGSAVLVRSASEFPTLAVAKNYLLASAAPAVILLGICLYWTEKGWIQSAMRSGFKRLFQLLFLLSYGGMMYYQQKELDIDGIKKTPFTYMTLPRIVYAINAAQVLYMLTGLLVCPNKLLYIQEPAKRTKIYVFFVFLMLSIIPSALMLFGPGQPILFLGLLTVLYGTNFALKSLGQANSFFQYVLYSVIAQMMFHATGHVLDFVSPKVQRAFVGFPEFNTAISFSLAFLDSMGPFTFTLLLTPILSIDAGPANAVPTEYNQLRLGEHDGSPKQQVSVQDSSEVEACIVKNLLSVLVHSETVHIAVARFLAANFATMFFEASHPEFTLRFIGWYLYFLSICLVFAIGKL